jgi:hypothetical protein
MIEANLHPPQPPEQDTWNRLLKQTELFAAGQAAVRWWRHAHDGVMPDGYDPSSIAAQAVTDLLQNRRVNKDQNLTEDQIRQIQNELERLVCQIVDRLRHRKENSLLCNEPDLATVFTDDGESVRIVETIPDPSPNPAETFLHAERAAEVEHRQNQFEATLAKDRPLKTLFGSFRRGLSTPRALARKLKTTTRAIDNLQKRLKRKWTQFVNHQACAKSTDPGKKS